MNFRVENIWMLLGLFALAVPVILHLLRRRHVETIDWGAMQFLPDTRAAQRRRWMDDLLLMLMRMAMIALIVIALATPVSTSPWLAPLADRSAREIVVVVDGSASMDVRVPGQPTPWQDAQRWLREHAEQAPGSDRIRYVIAQQPAALVDQPGERTPHGNPDVPAALAIAWKQLQQTNAATKEIIVLTDGQQHGWTDRATLAALENLGNQWHADVDAARAAGEAVPTLRVVKVGPEVPKTLPNYRLDPLTARHVVKVGQNVVFQGGLHLDGFSEFVPPRSVKAYINGEGKAQTLPVRIQPDLNQKLRFEHRFEQAGRHIVSLKVDADPKLDALPGDNEQKVVIEVVKELPILLVDGDAKVSETTSSYFLQNALASVRVVPQSALQVALIHPPAQARFRPAVIVLADVPTLDSAQIEAIDRFLADGGGLLIFAGERVERARAFYNTRLFRAGAGWLPAQLGDVAAAKDGMQADPRTFQHPAVQLFGNAPDGVMNQVRFAKWWKVPLGASDRAAAVGLLANGDPFLLERVYKDGRVILCTTPPDRRWGSTLPSAVEFPVLVNELATYLAAHRRVATPLEQGDIDPRESDLTRCTEDDWRRVSDLLPIAWHADGTADGKSASEPRREELWWLLLLAVVGLLCSEVWMTRRMALARGL